MAGGSPLVLHRAAESRLAAGSAQGAGTAAVGSALMNSWQPVRRSHQPGAEGLGLTGARLAGGRLDLVESGAKSNDKKRQ